MKLRSLVLFIVAISFVAMAGAAFAKPNEVTVSTTIENMVRGTTCGKAGSLGLSFPFETVIEGMDAGGPGDVIQFTLDDDVTICKDIDLWVVEDDQNTNPDQATGSVQWLDTNVGYFRAHIYSDKSNDRIIYVHVVNATSADGDFIRVGANGGDEQSKFDITFLDQKENLSALVDQADLLAKGGAEDLWYEDADGFQPATIYQNTLCLDISLLPASINKIYHQWDTPGVKLSFIGDKQIAFILGTQPISLLDCKGTECGTILIPSAQKKCGAEFDIEGNTGYCGEPNNQKLILEKPSQFSPSNAYYVEVEILVDGKSGNNGVYFSGTGVTANGFDTETCAPQSGSSVAPDKIVLNGSTLNYADLEAGDMELGVNSDDCSVPAEGKLTKIVTDTGDFGIAQGDEYLYIDVPSMVFDMNVVKAGQKVEVKVTLAQAPCNVLWTGKICGGTFVTTCTDASSSGTLLYPYFTQMNDDPAVDSYWDGIAVVNTTSSAVTATLKLYEADGDTGSYAVTIDPQSMFVNTLKAMLPDVVATGTLGDAPLYIKIETVPGVDGFAMIGNAATGESMGYLPRLSTSSSVD